MSNIHHVYSFFDTLLIKHLFIYISQDFFMLGKVTTHSQSAQKIVTYYTFLGFDIFEILHWHQHCCLLHKQMKENIMNKIDFNIPVLIFIVGAIMFLLAPLELFRIFNSNQLYLYALMVESLGVTMAFIVYFREKLSDLLI